MISMEKNIVKTLITLNLVFLLTILTGCEDEKVKNITDQSTPIEVIRKRLHASVNGQPEKFIECFYDKKGKYKKYIELAAKHDCLAYDYIKKVQKHYGDEGVTELGQLEFTEDAFYIIKKPPIKDEWIKELTISYTEKNKAFCQTRWDYCPFIRVHGVWFFDPDGYPTPVNVEKSIKFLTEANRAIEKTMPMVGKDGITVHDLKVEMAKYISSPDEPARKK